MRATDFLCEGVNCTMKLFLPVIGIDFRITNYQSSLMFSQNINLIPYQETNSTSGYTNSKGLNYDLLLVSDDKIQWYLFFWNHYSDFIEKKKPIIYTDFNDINRMWLYSNGAIFTFGYFPKNYIIDDFPKEIKSHMDIVLMGQIDFLKKYHPEEPTTANEQTT
jgi:hypothetical protein